MNKQHPKTLFSIDLRIAERKLTLNVYENDTIQNLLIRNNIIKHNQVNTNKFQRVKQKIYQTILKQIDLKKQQNQFILASKLQQFLLKQQANQQQLNDDYTPFKQLFRSNQKDLTVNQNYLNNKQPYLQKISAAQQKISIKQNCLNQKIISNKKKSNKKVDLDLIKAYQTILKKSKDKSMRQMAAKTLNQLNILTEKSPDQIIVKQNKIDKSSLLSINEQLMHQKHSVQQNQPSFLSETNSPTMISKHIKNKNYEYCSFLQQNQGSKLNLLYCYSNSNPSKLNNQYSYSCSRQNSYYMPEFNQPQKTFQKRKFKYLND